MSDDLYKHLSEQAPPGDDGREDKKDPPGTVYTASIETIDNDRAGTLLRAAGL